MAVSHTCNTRFMINKLCLDYTSVLTQEILRDLEATPPLLANRHSRSDLDGMTPSWLDTTKIDSRPLLVA
jgi:hypothetical protein